jgi:hypothetical protein
MRISPARRSDDALDFDLSVRIEEAGDGVMSGRDDGERE